jgi:DNA-binding beta-propeller fold protein YncE
VAVNPSRHPRLRVYVTENVAGGPVWVINTATRRIIYVIGQCHPTGVAVSPNGTHIYVADYQYAGNLAVITRESVVIQQ